MKKIRLLLVLFLAVSGIVLAQRRFGGGGEGGYISEDVRTAREVPQRSTETPMWTNPKAFERDVFTFARLRYTSGGFDGFGFGRGGSRWNTDTPDSDLNLSYRLQQMTSMKVSPDGRYLRLTDPDLADYPFVYIVEPGALRFSEPEVVALRKYLLNGGFLMLDDFWGSQAWNVVERELKRVFPERNFTELPLTHPVYHCVFEIKAKGQVPGISHWRGSGGETSERGEDSAVVHHRAIFDDKGRMMVVALHNTDNGDGWEREGEEHEYFERFSEKIAYPLGINVIFYVMTH